MRGLYLVTPDWNDTERLLDLTERGAARRRGADPVPPQGRFPRRCAREQAPALLAHVPPATAGRSSSTTIPAVRCARRRRHPRGRLDASVAAVRAALGPGKIVGASCYGDFKLARAAQAAGASYVAFGGFYPSTVKQYAVTTPDDIVTRAKAELSVPAVVIGGMTPANARPLVALGADMVAAIRQRIHGAGSVRRPRARSPACSEGPRSALASDHQCRVEREAAVRLRCAKCRSTSAVRPLQRTDRGDVGVRRAASARSRARTRAAAPGRHARRRRSRRAPAPPPLVERQRCARARDRATAPASAASVSSKGTPGVTTSMKQRQASRLQDAPHLRQPVPELRPSDARCSGSRRHRRTRRDKAAPRPAPAS